MQCNQHTYAQDGSRDQTPSGYGLKITKMPTAHTPPFNGPLSGTARVSRHQKGETNLDFTEARDSEWQ